MVQWDKDSAMSLQLLFCGICSIPGPGTSTYLQKKKKKKKKARERKKVSMESSFPLSFFFFFFFFLCVCVCVLFRVEWELKLPAYARATATPYLSHVCYLHHSSRQCLIFNSLSEVRDWTLNLMVPSRIHFCCTTIGTPASL